MTLYEYSLGNDTVRTHVVHSVDRRNQSVQMSSLRHSAHAQWTVPTEVVGGAASADDDAIEIMAKGDGTAASGGLTIAADLNAASPALPEVVEATAPMRRVRYEFSASVASVLPMAGDIVRTLAGAAALANDPNADAVEEDFRPVEAGVATGYVTDDARSLHR